MNVYLTLLIFLTYILLLACPKGPDFIILDNQICASANSYKDCSELTEVQKLFIKNLANEFPESSVEKDLITPPLEWGKEATTESNGKLIHGTSYKLGWVSLVQLNNLLPNHEYMLTLNGNPELDGNELLPKPVPGLEDERYWDILEIKTDSNGYFEKKIAVQLTPGDYHVRFYVKDQEDYKIVLYHDYFRFTVTD